jgi:hypothetical protein
MHHLLHHAQCADGFAAAVIAQRALLLQGVSAADIRLQPVNYPDTLQTPPDGSLHTEDHVYYLDYTPPQKTLDFIKSYWCESINVTIIDHHSKAADRHEKMNDGFTSVFDLGMSGALLTFFHFHPEEIAPDAIQLVSWRDLGHAFQQPGHRFTEPAFNLHATLMRATPRTPEAWSPILFTHSTGLLGRDLDIGKKLRAFDSHILDAAAYNPLWLDFHGQRIPALTGLGPEIMSEALSKVLFYQTEAPFAASWYVNATTGLFTYSLRSRKNGPNLAEIAATMAPGGGGHPCAAGFSTPTPIPFAE